jgi:hypothetical protein
MWFFGNPGRTMVDLFDTFFRKKEMEIYFKDALSSLWV